MSKRTNISEINILEMGVKEGKIDKSENCQYETLGLLE